METGTLGLNVLWQQADVVTRGVALMLLVMSVASWYVMLDKLLRLALFRLRSTKLLAAFWGAPTLKDGVQQLGQGSAWAEVTHTGISAARQHRDALDGDMNPPPVLVVACTASQPVTEASSWTDSRRSAVARRSRRRACFVFSSVRAR